VPLASHNAGKVAAAARSATVALTSISDEPSGVLSGGVRDAVAQEAGAISALDQAAQTIEQGNGQYQWTFMGTYISQLAAAVHSLSSACSTSDSSSENAACPQPAQLLNAWDTAPASVRRSWTGTGVTVSGFTDISCWESWVVAMPITEGNGTAVFSRQPELQLFPSSELAEFNNAVCSSSSSPTEWKNPAAGPATCGS
jgi:hypothetical protein